MKACLCSSYGPPDTLQIEDIPVPVLGDEEVLVRVSACGLNFADTLIIQGRYQFKPDLPFSPGGEFAGVVEAVGGRVDYASPGDRVMGYQRWGAARQFVAAGEDDIVPLPEDISFETAAGLTVTYGTAIHAFRDRANLQPGEVVAVLGASGGAGQAAVEIARLMGATVIACASSSEKLCHARTLGAHHLVDYTTQPLKETLKALTHGAGVDVVYDPVGGELAEQALRATSWEGRYLVVGFASGEIPQVPFNLIMLKGCDVRGVFWGEALARDPLGHRENMARLLKWVQTGRLKPSTHAVYPLDKIAEALNEIAERKVRGKVIVTP
ncbi:NADPH:quinone oxidoreductase family protein [Roseibium litorale]|uniref:NADPH:quinone oxidoreductase family protein n=1 Tax=Roseibium litorale TaxID=2803841 RepID=UPI001AD8C57A|nr:NADPH:quinone oxidoreductase family protein [Roseibium litorale]